MNIILGAGAAGFGAYAANPNSVIFEQNTVPGGLCGGFEVDGFHFDNAVHLSFSKIPEVRAVFDKVEQAYYNPRPYSWLKEQWIRHPAQNNLFPLSVEEKIQAVKSFVETPKTEEDDTFESWNKNRYGQYMWDHLFAPYNRKYWCVPLNELGVQWIGNRIYQPTLEEVLFGCFTDETPNTYYASEMRYPKNGGYFAFFEEIYKNAMKNGKLHFGKKAVSVDRSGKQITFSDGSVEKYDKLLSSVPLPELIAMTTNVPNEIRDMAAQLEHTGIALVSFALNKVIDRDRLWFYIYDEDILAARAHYPSSKAESNAANGCSSIQFEIYFYGDEQPVAKQEAIDNCIYALEKLGIATKDDILFSDYRILPYANVISMKKTQEYPRKIVQWLEKNDIMPIGRFGRWEYLWSDQSYLSGYCASQSFVV